MFFQENLCGLDEHLHRGPVKWIVAQHRFYQGKSFNRNILNVELSCCLLVPELHALVPGNVLIVVVILSCVEEGSSREQQIEEYNARIENIYWLAVVTLVGCGSVDKFIVYFRG